MHLTIHHGLTLMLRYSGLLGLAVKKQKPKSDIELLELQILFSVQFLYLHIIVSIYCKSTKFGVLLNLADLVLGQKLNGII